MRPQECGHIAHTHHSGISFTNLVISPQYRPRVKTHATNKCAYSPHQSHEIRIGTNNVFAELMEMYIKIQTFNLFSMFTVKLNTELGGCSGGECSVYPGCDIISSQISLSLSPLSSENLNHDTRHHVNGSGQT